MWYDPAYGGGAAECDGAGWAKGPPLDCVPEFIGGRGSVGEVAAEESAVVGMEKTR